MIMEIGRSCPADFCGEYKNFYTPEDSVHALGIYVFKNNLKNNKEYIFYL